MAWYFVDYENTNWRGIAGAHKLKKTEHLVVGRSNNCNGRVGNVDTNCDARFVNVTECTKNAMDFALIADMGVHLRKNGRFYLISKDKGFDAALHQWRGMGYDVSRASSLEFAMRAEGYTVAKVGHYSSLDNESDDITRSRVRKREDELVSLRMEEEREAAIARELEHRENALVESIFAELVRVEKMNLELEAKREEEKRMKLLEEAKEKKRLEQEERKRRQHEIAEKKKIEKENRIKEIQNKKQEKELMNAFKATENLVTMLQDPRGYISREFRRYVKQDAPFLTDRGISIVINAFKTADTRKEFKKNIKKLTKDDPLSFPMEVIDEITSGFTKWSKKLSCITLGVERQLQDAGFRLVCADGNVFIVDDNDIEVIGTGVMMIDSDKGGI